MQTIQFEPSQSTILVVEDNATNMRLLIELLLNEGYDVQSANNGPEAIAMARAALPNLVLLDIMIPGFNGYEVCQTLKNDPQTGEIPVVFVTAMAQVSDKIKAFELGAADYITKPFNTKEVMVRIKNQLVRRSQYKQLQEKVRDLEQTLSSYPPSPLSLSDSQQMLGALLQNLPGMVYRCRNYPQWPFDFVSQGSLPLTGYPPNDLMSGEIAYGTDIIHPDDQRWVWERVQEAIATNHSFELIYRIYTKDRTLKWVWEKGCPIWSSSGELTILEGFIQDRQKC